MPEVRRLVSLLISSHSAAFHIPHSTLLHSTFATIDPRPLGDNVIRFRLPETARIQLFLVSWVWGTGTGTPLHSHLSTVATKREMARWRQQTFTGVVAKVGGQKGWPYTTWHKINNLSLWGNLAPNTWKWRLTVCLSVCPLALLRSRKEPHSGVGQPFP